jgi:hypothetical protein
VEEKEPDRRPVDAAGWKMNESTVPNLQPLEPFGNKRHVLMEPERTADLRGCSRNGTDSQDSALRRGSWVEQRVSAMMAPGHIDLVYRKVDDEHIFASKGIKGLVHVGHTSLEQAYDRLLEALTFHVRHTYRVDARYDCERGFEGLKKKVHEGGELVFVHAHLQPPIAA